MTASTGGTPLRICPVIIPGSETRPVADIELMVGISALRSASRVTGAAAPRHTRCRLSEVSFFNVGRGWEVPEPPGLSMSAFLTGNAPRKLISADW